MRIMNELIKITEKEGKRVVSARDLHEFLGLEERFSKWFDRFKEYGFDVDVDYTPYQMVHPSNNQEINDFAITIDMAKELSMLQRTDKGKEARKYFIECEKVALNARPTASISDTMLFADAAARILGMNENSKLLMIQTAAKVYGVPLELIPSYTKSVDQLLSGTELLKRNESDWSIRTFNSVMMDKDMMEEKERPSKSGTKKFKSLIGKGLGFGENQVCPNNPRETQPLYYTDKFDSLLTILKR